MPSTGSTRPVFLLGHPALLGAVWMLSACGGEEPVGVQTVPRTPAPAVDLIRLAGSSAAPLSPRPSADQAEQPAGAFGAGTQMRWTAPESWAASDRTNQFRVATLLPESGGEVAVSRVVGPPSNMTAQVNRWRGQIGLPATDARGVTATVTNAAHPEAVGYRTRLNGPDGRSMAVAWYEFEDASWFYKLTGSETEVDAAEPMLHAMADGSEVLRAGSPAPSPASAAGEPPRDAYGRLPTDPHYGHNHPSDDHAGHEHAGGHSHGDTPQNAAAGAELRIGFTVPATWTRKPAEPPRLVGFDTAAGADVAVTFFAGGAGEVLPNINRWRNQVGLDPVTQASEQPAFGYPKADPVMPVYEVVGEAGSILAVQITDAAGDWFVKLSGPPSAAAAERDAFATFIDDLRLPLSAPPPPPRSSSPTPEP